MNDPLLQFKANLDQFSALTKEFSNLFHAHHVNLQEIGFSEELSDELLLVFADHAWELALRNTKPS